MSRNLRRYGFTAELLAVMFSQGNEKRFTIVDGPRFDAQLVNAYIEPEGRVVWLVLSHPTFDEVEEGAEIPPYHLEIELSLQEAASA